MGQVLSAYGREGLETIIIVTVLLAKAGLDRVARRDVLLGAVIGFLVSTMLVVMANGWADDHVFARVDGYSGATIGVVISAIVCYHAFKRHSSIKEVGFVISFGLVSIESFEIGLQTIGVGLAPRLIGIAIAVAVFGLFFGTYHMLGKRPPTARLQFVATIALVLTAFWLIIKSFKVLEEKHDLWFGYLCLVLALCLVGFALIKGKPEKHTASL